MNLKEKLLLGFKKAATHNSSVMVPPKVILWTDPLREWEAVIKNIQDSYKALFVLGEYVPEELTGPAIWLKTILSKELSEPKWNEKLVPVIYLPGISKNQLKDITNIGIELQPLVEYVYTGTLFSQTNGKDWTVMSMMQNPDDGLGINIRQDNATKETVVKSLSVFFEMVTDTFSGHIIDADFINTLVFPHTISYILKWMCTGDKFLNEIDRTVRETFLDICKSRYGIELDYKNILDIAQKLGKQQGGWKQVWNFYANSPAKYPEIQSLLEQAQPTDLGFGLFKIPDESWPKINEVLENELRKDLDKLAQKDLSEIYSELEKFQNTHSERKNWVWAELGNSPLIFALEYLVKLADIVNTPYPSSNLNELISYYTIKGYLADQYMRKAYAVLRLSKDKKVINKLIQLIYKPWIERITIKFQKLVDDNMHDSKSVKSSNHLEQFYLFVDAFRYETAKEYTEILLKKGFKVELSHSISAFPSLTATAKVKNSPIVSEVSNESNIKDFAPQFKSGNHAIIRHFRAELEKKGFIHSVKDRFDPSKSYWVEIGNIDERGHNEQSSMLRRMDELFNEISEIIDCAIENGIRKIKIVTDHGWLMLPGGLPSEKIIKDLTVARCGRCAIIKDGVKTNLFQLPWEWNPTTYITYAPNITFFRKNEEYAHGGISLQECIIPQLIIEIDEEKIINSKIKSHKWINLRCTVKTLKAPDGYKVDIRTKFNDEKTSIVLSSTQNIFENKCSLMVDDSNINAAAFLVLTDENGKILDKTNTTIGN